MTWTVYLITCNTPNHVYVGQTQNFNDRMRRHQYGGTAFTKRHGVSTITRIAVVSTRDKAVQRETALARTLVNEGKIVGGVSVTGAYTASGKCWGAT